MSSTYEKIRETTLSMLNGFNTNDTDAIFAPWADNCTHQVVPESLGRETETQQEYRLYLDRIRPLFSDIKRDIDNIIIDTTAKKAAAHAFVTATTPVGPWHMETTYLIAFDETGEKVTLAEELVDSASTERFSPKFREFMANK